MAGHTDNEILIAAPVDLVWSITNDLENWPQLFSEYASVEVLERRGESTTFRLTMHPDETARCGAGCPSAAPTARRWRSRPGGSSPGPFEFMDIHWHTPRAPTGPGCAGSRTSP